MVEQNDEHENSDTNSAPEQSVNKKSNGGLIVAVVGVVLIIAVAAGAFFFLHKGEHSTDAADEHKEEVVSNPGYYVLDDLIVNLSGDAKRPNYLKLKIVIELADENDKDLMDNIKPKIIDKFQTYLRELRVDDLKGSVGMYRLREELLIRITEVSKPVRIKDILLQEILVQ